MRFVLACLILLAGCAPAPQAEAPPSPGNLTVLARSIPLHSADPARVTIGKLRYRGGLHLTAPDPRFGGLSGLRWDGEALLAVTDGGDALRLSLREEGDELKGVASARMVRLAGLDGRPLASKVDADAEALELEFEPEACEGLDRCAPARVSIAFERDHRVWSYELRDRLPSGRPRPLWEEEVDRRWLASLPLNGGVEAMADFNEQISLILAEESGDAVIYHNGLASDAPAQYREALSLGVARGFKPTDAVFGDTLLILRRAFSPSAGAAARVEAITLAETDDNRRIGVGRPVLLAELRPPFSVDNMEGLALRLEGGRTFLYLVSDNNFSATQRTLLLKFELTG